MVRRFCHWKLLQTRTFTFPAVGNNQHDGCWTCDVGPRSSIITPLLIMLSYISCCMNYSPAIYQWYCELFLSTVAAWTVCPVCLSDDRAAIYRWLYELPVLPSLTVTRTINIIHIGSDEKYTFADEVGCLLGCCAVKCGRRLPTFQRLLLPPWMNEWMNECKWGWRETDPCAAIIIDLLCVPVLLIR
jgi:hypothetical protein